MFKNILQSIKDKIFPSKATEGEESDSSEEQPQDAMTRSEARRAAREERKEDRKDKVEDRRNYRLEKIAAIKEKFYAVASKRKWLFFVIAGAIVAYLVIFKGGFGGGDILTKIKGFFG